MSSSWNDDASQTTVAAGSRAPARAVSAVPTLPAAATGRPAARCIAATSSVVVVFPLEPVIAISGFGSSRQPSSSSPRTTIPRARAARMTAASPGTPGLLTTVPTPSSSATPSLCSCTATPAASSSARASGATAAPSQPVTSSPSARRMRPGGAARAGEADEQERAGRERRSGHPGPLKRAARSAPRPVAARLARRQDERQPRLGGAVGRTLPSVRATLTWIVQVNVARRAASVRSTSHGRAAAFGPLPHPGRV